MVIVVVIVLGFRLDPRMSPPRATRRTPMMSPSGAPLGGGYRPDGARLVNLLLPLPIVGGRLVWRAVNTSSSSL